MYTRQDFILSVASIDDGKPIWLEKHKSGGLASDINVAFRIGGLEDLGLLSELVNEKKLQNMRIWFQDGHRVYMAIDGGKPVYYEWVAFENFYDPFLGLTIPVKEDECLAFDAYTHPDYRFKNILRSVSSKIILDCYHNKKRRKIMSYVTSERWPLFQRFYRITGLGIVRPKANISRIRILGIWTGKMTNLKDE